MHNDFLNGVKCKSLMEVPDDEPWDDKANLPHDAWIKTIGSLHWKEK